MFFLEMHLHTAVHGGENHRDDEKVFHWAEEIGSSEKPTGLEFVGQCTGDEGATQRKSCKTL